MIDRTFVLDADVALYQALAITSFKDGYFLVEKAAETLEKYLTLFIVTDTFA